MAGALRSGTIALLCVDVSRVAQDTLRQTRRIAALHDGVEVDLDEASVLLAFRTASRAIDAALAMQHDLGTGDLRIAVHAAERVVHGRNDFGDATAVVRQMFAAAHDGVVVVSDVVSSLISDRRDIVLGVPVASTDLRSTHITEVRRSDDATRVPLPPELLRRSSLPLVGRDAALSQIRQACEQGGLVVVQGPAGIGKTRLLTEVSRLLHAQDVLVLYGAGDSVLRGAYRPIADALRHVVRLVGVNRLEAELGSHLRLLARIIPELDDHRTDEQGLSDPGLEQALVVEAVAAVLRWLSRSSRVVLVLDDLQWCDPSTLTLASALSARPALDRLTVIGACRNDEPSARLVDFLGRVSTDPRLTRVALEGLGEADVRALLSSAGPDADIDADGRSFAELATEITRRTGGNPFLVTQTLTHPHDGPHALSGVRQLVEERFQRLDDRAVRSIEVASVLGLEFDLWLLAATADVDPDVVLSHLEAGIATGLLEEDDIALDRFRFSHALVREALYDSLSATRRALLHRVAGTALRGSPELSATAHHFLAAGRAAPAEETIPAVLLAAEDGIERTTGYPEADELVDRAFATVPLPFDSPWRCDLLVMRAQVAAFEGRYDDARPPTIEAVEIAERCDDAHRLARALTWWCRGVSTYGQVDHEMLGFVDRALAMLGPEPHPSKLQLMAAAGTHRLFAGDIERAELSVLDAHDAAVEIGDSATIVLAALSYRLISSRHPQRERRRDLLDVIERGLDDTGARISVLHHRQTLACERGDRAAFDQLNLELGKRATAAGSLTMQATSTRGRAALALCEGQFDDAEKLADESLQLNPSSFSLYGALLLAIKRERGRSEDLFDLVRTSAEAAPHTLGWQAALAALSADLGHRDEARSTVERCAEQSFRVLDGEFAAAATMAMFSDAITTLGAADLAAALAPRVLRWCGQALCLNEIYFGAADRHAAALLLTAGEPERGIPLLESAIAFDEAFGASLWANHGRARLADALRRRGHPGDGARADRLAEQAESFAAVTGAALVLASR